MSFQSKASAGEKFVDFTSEAGASEPAILSHQVGESRKTAPQWRKAGPSKTGTSLLLEISHTAAASSTAESKKTIRKSLGGSARYLISS